MGGEIQFGEVEQLRPGRRRRPDRDRHFAVCPYGAPVGGDLPIFVDMDVLAEIEAHARSDPSVELGGVLLGGQFEDQEGNPFVLVLDSLRAEHYESSRGHFKFTHDTWAQISRQRDQFSEDLQMVGWYHTHPDWGVFLSGMDRFICKNFFNRPLDVALVVDPLRGDRGWFYWVRGGEELPRAQGFHVIASRLRRRELQTYVELLQGDGIMTTERPSGGAPPGADLRLPQQVIHTIRPQLGWIGAAVLAMLVLQVCTTLLVALRIGPPTATQGVPDRPATPGELSAQQERAAELDRREQRLAAGEQVFHDVVGQVKLEADGSLNVDSLVKEYTQLRHQADQLRKTDLLLDQAAGWIDRDRKVLQATVRNLEASNQQLAARNERLLGEIEELKASHAADRQASEKQIAQLKRQLPGATEAGVEKEEASGIGGWTTVAAVGGGLLILGTLAAVMLVRRIRRRLSPSIDHRAAG
jgi:proteasome lid subunit RPN8/RPN11